jgi:anti-sigma regulatory factor (Ser/Thr protein kinase)
VNNRPANVRLELDSQPEAVALVRAALSGIAEWRELDPELVNDLKTAVSEACNNVVVHAYDGPPGPLAVHVAVDDAGLSTTVRDRGVGFQAVAAHAQGMGVGLAVISALAARAEFDSPADGGTEVRMWFPSGREQSRPLAHFNSPLDLSQSPPEFLDADHTASPYAYQDRDIGLDQPDGEAFPSTFDLWGDVRVTVSPVSMTAHVLGRLARALAATARFSFDRFSDMYLVADAIGAHAQHAAADDRISFSLLDSAGSLRLTIGPFPTGSSAALMRGLDHNGEPESPLSLLADEIRVDGNGRSEMLHVVLRDRGADTRSAADG